MSNANEKLPGQAGGEKTHQIINLKAKKVAAGTGVIFSEVVYL